MSFNPPIYLPISNLSRGQPSGLEDCMNYRYWPLYVASIVGTLLAGLLLILLYRIAVKLMSYCSRCKADRAARASSSPRSPEYSFNTPPPFNDSGISNFDEHGTAYQKPLARRCTQGLVHCIHQIQPFAIHLVSYQWPIGRFFIAASMLLSLASFGIFVAEATMWPNEIEKCGHKGRKLRAVDFSFNLFFLLHFSARFAAAENKLMFWIDWFSILDYCTVPPTIVAFVLQRSWMGLRFVRIFRLFNLAEVLHNLNVIKSVSSLRLCQISSFFFAVWLSGAGMVYVLENTGDPFGEDPYGNAVTLSYTDCLYFTLVTMSTVGYGDITPATLLGRLFVNIFILFALAAFASCIPEIADMLFSTSQYSGRYLKSDNRRHVIVCGDVTAESVKHFLDDFLHADRRRTDVDVVFINHSQPDLELRSILHRNFTRVKYFQGTVMNHVDLHRVCMSTADACLILANSQAVDPNQEDATNIMRVVAVKNYASHVRVIVQILQQSNKTHLLNIPTWNWNAGDEIICLNEIKLGFLAQSCLAPGFSTLLTNLFSMQSLHGSASLAKAVVTIKNRPAFDSPHHSPPHHRRVRMNSINIALQRVRSLYRSSIHQTQTQPRPRSADTARSASVPAVSIEEFSCHEARLDATSMMPRTFSTGGYHWLKDYLRGVSMELYSANFSASFEGMTFTQAAVLCMNKLDLMLLALVCKSPPSADGGEGAADYLLINPPASSTLITEGMLGIFICDSQEIASRVTHYCSNCHGDLRRIDKIKECACRQRRWGLRMSKLRWRLQKTPLSVSDDMETSSRTVANPLVEIENSSTSKCSDSIKQAGNVDEQGDSTGSNRTEREVSVFDVTGVYHWTRKRSIEEAILPNNLDIPSTISKETAQAYMQNHILVCLLAAPSAPLLGLRSFVLPLRASNIEQRQLRPIVFLGDLEFLRQEWQEISNFPKVFLLPGSPLSRKNLWRARIHVCSVCVVLGISDTVHVDDPYMLDKEVILCALNIRALKIPHGMPHFVSNEPIVRRSGAEIPLLTALTMDSNIHFLDPEDFATGKSDVHVYLTIPFARGLAFSASVLDALVSTAYFDRNAITLIRYLVTGGTTPVLEKWASYGGEFYANLDIQDDAIRRIEGDLAKRFIRNLSQNKYKRPQLRQMSFRDSQLASIRAENGRSQLCFGKLFCQALTQHGILCLGLFRLSPPAQVMLNARTDIFWSPLKKHAHEVLGQPVLPHNQSACSPEDIPQVQCSSKANSVREQAQLPSFAASLHVPQTVSSKIDSGTIPSFGCRVAGESNYPAANSRYVITNPPIDFPVYGTDLVFCLTPHS
ncbi:unnamed protein product [Schistocephalus solidus]|uniref:BK channel n=1 Tax=Schistocephalus solidus TaxID=70667 RepID=A0A183T372_SCHSO|nr:unnamed protein product [Schistocephalus solidus]